MLKKWWPTILTAAGVLAGFLNPSMQSYFAAHGQQGALALSLWSIVLHQLRSPHQ